MISDSLKSPTKSAPRFQFSDFEPNGFRLSDHLLEQLALKN